MNIINTGSSESLCTYLKLLPDENPFEIGHKPLRLNFLVRTCGKVIIKYSRIAQKKIKIVFIDPTGQRHQKTIQKQCGKIEFRNPAQGEWSIVLLGNEAEKIKFDFSGNSSFYCYPHTRSPLTIEPGEPGIVDLYIEVPQYMSDFMFSATGGISKLEFHNLAGNKVLCEPVNGKPYLASAKNRFVYKIRPENKSDRLINLRIYHQGTPLTVAIRERMRFFFSSPAEALPYAGVCLETVDEDNGFFPCRINIFRDNQWWKAVYTEVPGQNIYLPPGNYMFQAEHGYEYIPVRKYVTATPELRTKLLFKVRKGLFRAENCYCGDIHVHSTVSDGTGTIAELFHAAKCNGLDWMAFSDHANRSYKETCPEGMKLVKKLSGRNGVIGIPGVETDTHYPQNHYNALNIKDFVHPEKEVVNQENGAAELVPKSVAEVFSEVMKQDSRQRPVICVLNHPMHGACEGEKVLREHDCFKIFEVSTGNHHYSLKQRLLEIWFDLLNQGRRLSAVAGTDTHHFDYYPPGAERVYCYVKGRPSRKKIIEALRDGRSFCVWAPVLPVLKVNGSMSGDTVFFSENSREIKIEMSCQSLLPLDRIDLVFNGDVVESMTVEDQIETNSADWEYPVNASSVFDVNKKTGLVCTDSGWLLLLVYLRGRKGHYAVTNPVYIEEKHESCEIQILTTEDTDNR